MVISFFLYYLRVLQSLSIYSIKFRRRCSTGFWIRLWLWNYALQRYIHRNSHRKCSLKKVVLKIFAIFTGKHLCCSFFLINFQAWNMWEQLLLYPGLPEIESSQQQLTASRCLTSAMLVVYLLYRVPIVHRYRTPQLLSCITHTLIFQKNNDVWFRSSRPAVFCKKVVLGNFAKFTGKHLCQSLFINKVAASGLQLHQKRDSGRCFPMNSAKFLRTPFFTDYLRWLLLLIWALG